MRSWITTQLGYPRSAQREPSPQGHVLMFGQRSCSVRHLLGPGCRPIPPFWAPVWPAPCPARDPSGSGPPSACDPWTLSGSGSPSARDPSGPGSGPGGEAAVPQERLGADGRPLVHPGRPQGPVHYPFGPLSVRPAICSVRHLLGPRSVPVRARDSVDVRRNGTRATAAQGAHGSQGRPPRPPAHLAHPHVTQWPPSRDISRHVPRGNRGHVLPCPRFPRLGRLESPI